MKPDQVVNVAVAILRSRMADAAGPSGRAWCDGLPRLIRELLWRWELTLTGEPAWAGFGGLAVAVERADHGPAVLKVTFSQNRVDYESEILARWNGKRAACLLERDDTRHSRLLERLGSKKLFDHPDSVTAMAVAGDLAASLAVIPPTGLVRMADLAPQIAEQLTTSRESKRGPLSARDVNVAAATFRDLGGEQPSTLLHGDLQGRNILQSTREEWAVIDPQGLVGEVALEALTGLRDRWAALRTQSNPREALRRQLAAFAEGARAPTERVLAWTHARSVRAVLAGVADDDGMHAWVATNLASMVA